MAKRPFELVKGVPAALVRALDRGEALPDAWRVPVKVVIFSSRDGDRLVPFGEAGDYGAALRMIVDACQLSEGGDLDAYPMASPEITALVAELRDPALRSFCLMIENTLTALWPGELSEALYLRGLARAFPGTRFVVGWEATGPMVDLAWAFLVPGRGLR